MNLSHPLIAWFFTAVLAAMVIQCSSTASEVQELNETDRLVIDVGPHDGSNSAFMITITTEESYGCGAFLNRKLNRTQGGVSIEITGVVPGEPGCANEGAEPLEEPIRLRFESGMTLEVRHRRDMDRYRLEMDGNGWETDRIYNGLGTKLSAAEGD